MQIFSLMQIYSRTRLKIELLTKEEVLYIKEATDFFQKMTYFMGRYTF